VKRKNKEQYAGEERADVYFNDRDWWKSRIKGKLLSSHNI
jgi:hypothetical protein